MNFQLSGYSGPEKLVIVAKTDAFLKQQTDLGRECMFCKEGEIILYPEEQVIFLSDREKKHIALLNQNDILQISGNGFVYRAFDMTETDTTVFMGGSCNSNCRMCPATDAERRKGYSYPHRILFRYLDYLPDDLEFIIITGGEPTMNWRLFLVVLQKLKEKYPLSRVLLLTNGRSLANKYFFEGIIRRKPNNFRLAIPIHGPNAELHDYITQAEGSFKQSFIAIKRALKDLVEVEIRIVVTLLNCDFLQQIAELIVKEFPGVICVNFVGLEPRGSCFKNKDTVYIDLWSAFKKCKPAVDYLIGHGVDTGFYNFPLCAVERKYWPITQRSIAGYKDVYAPECDKCIVKDKCAGMFVSTLKIIKPVVCPVIDGEKND